MSRGRGVEFVRLVWTGELLEEKDEEDRAEEECKEDKYKIA